MTGSDTPSVVADAKDEPSVVVVADTELSVVAGAKDEPSVVVAADTELSAKDEPSVAAASKEDEPSVIVAAKEPSIADASKEELPVANTATDEFSVMEFLPLAFIIAFIAVVYALCDAARSATAGALLLLLTSKQIAAMASRLFVNSGSTCVKKTSGLTEEVMVTQNSVRAGEGSMLPTKAANLAAKEWSTGTVRKLVPRPLLALLLIHVVLSMPSLTNANAARTSHFADPDDLSRTVQSLRHELSQAKGRISELELALHKCTGEWHIAASIFHSPLFGDMLH